MSLTDETHCEDRQWAAFHKDGSYAEYVVLHAKYTNKLPDGYVFRSLLIARLLICLE